MKILRHRLFQSQPGGAESAPSSSRGQVLRPCSGQVFRLLPILLLLLSCSLLPQAPAPTPTVEATESPAPTNTPPPAETSLPVATPGPATSTMTGRVCYPSEFIPEMTAYFLNTDTQTYTEVPIAMNQESYDVRLEPGNYLAFAWREEYGLGGGYTAAVACGMDASCSDHSLLSVELQDGQTLSGIDLCDWILMDLPLPPRPTFPESASFPEVSGVLFSAPDGLWRINAGGVAERLTERPDAQLSPDGRSILYWETGDIWQMPLAGGEATNLTNTPDRIEHLYPWKASGPDFLLFPSYPADAEVGPGFNGYLTMVRTDGSGYQVLDPEHPVWNFALSPDGGSVAYGLGPSGWLYRFADDSITAFDPRTYGLQGIGTLGSPSWSPDGTRLAWLVGFQQPQSDSPGFALAVFDLSAGTHLLLHPFDLPGMDGYPQPGVWSPDGKWLAVQIYDIVFERSGLWVFDLEGNEVFLGGGNPVWSPDGGRLLISGPEGHYRLAEAGSWQTVELEDLPLKIWYALEWR